MQENMGYAYVFYMKRCGEARQKNVKCKVIKGTLLNLIPLVNK